MFYDWWLGNARLADVVGSDAQIASFGHNLHVNQWWADGRWRIPTAFAPRCPSLARQVVAVQLNDQQDRVTWIHTGKEMDSTL